MNSLLTSSNTIGYSPSVASSFDSTRGALKDEQRMNDLIRKIRELTLHHSGIKLLDLGCGSGLFTIELAKKLDCLVLGADRSDDMLSLAKRKTGSNLVYWDREDATSLSYESDEFDVVFMSNLLHHIDNPLTVIQQCKRILRPGGILLNHYGALEDIVSDPEHRFFPECTHIDSKRTPSKKQVEEWLQQAEFENVSTTRTTYQMCESVEERLRCVENKYISVLHMISSASFDSGLIQLRNYAAAHPSDTWLLGITMSTTSGRNAIQRS